MVEKAREIIIREPSLFDPFFMNDFISLIKRSIQPFINLAELGKESKE